MAVTIFIVAWVGLLGYLFGAVHLYSIGVFSTMAVHTAVAVLLLSVGVQATIPGSLLVWAARSQDAGGFALRQFLPVAAFVLPAIAYARLAGQQLGWYGTEFGLALMVTASSIIVCFVAARASGRLTRMDTERAHVLAELETLNVDLERRVDERTNDLAASEAWARSLAASAPIGIFHTDAAGACTYTNDRWQEICGIRAVDALGAGWKAGIHPNDRPEARAAWNRAAATATVFDAEYRVRRPTRDVRWVHARATGVVDLAGNVTGFVGTLEDTTERRVAEDQFRTAFESAPIGMALKDRDGAFVQTNAALSDMVGYDSDELRSMPASSLVHPDDLGVLENRQAGPLDRRLLCADGTIIWTTVRLAPIVDHAGEAGLTLAQILDVTEKRRSEAELFHMANHDPLTGLLNRRSFEAALEAHVAHSRRYGPAGALLFVDIDHFKAVNDAHGHHLGDEVIVAVSNAMRARLRGTDIIARVGGDEFAVLLPTGGADVVRHVADMLVDVLRSDIANVGGLELGLTASIGLALFEVAGLSAAEMLIKADLAMYDAKARGRDQWAEALPQNAPA
jgi:diguanylate cyclase (GGDEF)-like protein/PAS domain S-box-containing protein